MRVVDCGNHVDCWSSPRPEDLGHYSGVETLLSTLLFWAGSAEIGGLLSRLDSPECVWPGWLGLELVAIGTDPQM